MPIFKMITRKVNLWVLCIGSVILTALFKQYVHFQYSDRVLPAFLCYFVIGAAVGINYDKVLALVKKFFIAETVVFAIFAYADVYLIYKASVTGVAFKYIEILHIFFCLSAILFLLGFCALLFEGRELFGFVKLLDRSSYQIFLSHVFFIYLANKLSETLMITGTLEKFVFRFVFTYATTVGFCMLYTFAVEKIKNGRKTSRSLS